MKRGGADVERGAVFPNKVGKWMTRGAANRAFYQRVKRASVRRIRFHDLRHTCATLLLLAGVNVKVVAARLGHSSVQITLTVYMHILPAMEDQALAALGAIFGDSPTEGYFGGRER